LRDDVVDLYIVGTLPAEGGRFPTPLFLGDDTTFTQSPRERGVGYASPWERGVGYASPWERGMGTLASPSTGGPPPPHISLDASEATPSDHVPISPIA